MGMRHEDGIESTASVLRHPVHPLLVPLPITAFLGVFVADFVDLFAHSAFLAELSFWLLVAGIATGILAGIAGAIDFMTLPGVRSLDAAQVHAIGNCAVLVVALCNLGVRWYQPAHFAGWPILLSAGTAGLLAITGWLGGSLAYKHRIGQIAPEHGGMNLARPGGE